MKKLTKDQAVPAKAADAVPEEKVSA